MLTASGGADLVRPALLVDPERLAEPLGFDEALEVKVILEVVAEVLQLLLQQDLLQLQLHRHDARPVSVELGVGVAALDSLLKGRFHLTRQIFNQCDIAN